MTDWPSFHQKLDVSQTRTVMVYYDFYLQKRQTAHNTCFIENSNNYSAHYLPIFCTTSRKTCFYWEEMSWPSLKAETINDQTDYIWSSSVTYYRGYRSRGLYCTDYVLHWRYGTDNSIKLCHHVIHQHIGVIQILQMHIYGAVLLNWGSVVLVLSCWYCSVLLFACCATTVFFFFFCPQLSLDQWSIADMTQYCTVDSLALMHFVDRWIYSVFADSLEECRRNWLSHIRSKLWKTVWRCESSVMNQQSVRR